MVEWVQGKEIERIRVNKVDADEIILDQNLTFFQFWNGNISTVLENFWTTGSFDDNAFHLFGKGRHSVNGQQREGGA